MPTELSLDKRLTDIADRLTAIIDRAEGENNSLTSAEIEQLALCEKELSQFVDSYGSLQDLGITRL